jgi:predicted permease
MGARAVLGRLADSELRDVRFAWRALWRRPLSTTVAVGSLAIGIGANVAVFGLADSVLMARPPVREPERLVELIAAYPHGSRQTNLPFEMLDPLQGELTRTAEVVASHQGSARLREGGEAAVPTRVLHVSDNYFSALGVGIAAGRPLIEADSRTGAPFAVVLSHRFWKSRWGGRPDIVGRGIWLDGEAATIVGIAPADFHGLERTFDAELFLPRLSPERQLWIVARLRAGLSLEAARPHIETAFAHALEAMRDQLSAWAPGDRARFLAQRVELRPVTNGTAGLTWVMEEPLRTLGMVVVLVLIVACANVSALQLSRGEQRLGEMALRMSIGAGRGRVMGQLVTESLLLATLGGTAGLGVGAALHALLRRLAPIDVPALDFGWTWRLAAFMLVVVALSGLATGLFPATRLARLQPAALLQGGRTTAGGWRSGPRRTILVVQVAGAVALLAAAGLIVRTLWNLRNVETGFERREVLIVSVDPAGGPLRETPMGAWAPPLADRLSGLPGVRQVAIAASAAFSGQSSWILDAWVESRDYSSQERHAVSFNRIGPGFLSTVGIPLLAGREFASTDMQGPAVAIVSRAFARKYFGAASAIGRRFGTSENDRGRYEIVGVASDVKVRSLREGPLPVVYFPVSRHDEARAAVIHLEISSPPDALASAIRREVARHEPDLTIESMRTLADEIEWTLERPKLFVRVLLLLAGVALFLTVIGLNGTMAYATTRRRHEIGVRMALGATRGDVVRGVLREALVIVLTGSAIGMAVAVACVPVLGSLPFQVRRVDWPSLAVAVLAAIVAALAAVAAPAAGAARTDPAAALRHE